MKVSELVKRLQQFDQSADVEVVSWVEGEHEAENQPVDDVYKARDGRVIIDMTKDENTKKRWQDFRCEGCGTNIGPPVTMGPGFCFQTCCDCGAHS